MNLQRTYTLAAFLLLGAIPQLRAELFSVVEITDLRGKVAFQICTETEKRKIESDLNAEARAYPKALEETMNEWQQNHAGAAFPNGRLKPRSLRTVATTIKREEADKILSQNKGHEVRTLASEKEEKDHILNEKPNRVRRGNGQAAIEQQKREIRENRERDAAADKAETVLRQKLSAAVGHDIPSYGQPSEEPKKAAPKKKKK